MKHPRFQNMGCPVASSLEHIGEWWNVLILRDAFYGLSRFQQFQESLGISSNILTRRLNVLVTAQLLEKQLYNDRPPRYDYVLTPSGRAFRPVMLTLMAWGNTWYSPDGQSVFWSIELLASQWICNSSTSIAARRSTAKITWCSQARPRVKRCYSDSRLPGKRSWLTLKKTNFFPNQSDRSCNHEDFIRG